ncbi:MAG: ABC transporter ATP-binding protein [Candidatus Poseidoniia archaeon]|nr:ABC transporter ATP-binding protein [Candidatus Poseidoniia archaeon]MDP7536117.1 ABC transporter ATP-binding protein [Candidatus Poseidoniia archaeon]MDP7607990.1 ABC transporter ATP-binding protein [Candidatus Poseidoniia archaeon]HJP44348.1 ABC transporter ATP-binding protein [Candidatus Poseidoniia archaeon]
MLLELEDVQKGYPVRRWGREVSRVEALRGLDLSVPEGAMFGFLGPNGAGKTTAISCIVGILRADAGAIRLDGEPLDATSGRAEIGYLPEQVGLHGHLTAEETLQFYGAFHGLARDDIDAHGGELLGQLGLAGETTRAVRGFSLGMRKRLALAVALLHRPRLLVLDEPTLGLDPRGVAALRKLLRQFNSEGLTILLSSHVLAEVQLLCSEVAIIHRGRLVRQAPVDELRNAVADAGQRVTLKLGDFLPKMLDYVEAMDGVVGAHAAPEKQHTRLEVQLSGITTASLTSALVELGTLVFSVEPHEPTLEDVFLVSTEEEE